MLTPPTRLSARFGTAYAASQSAVVTAMAVFVLPRAGAPDAAPLERGLRVLDAQQTYRLGNFALMISGMLLLGFLGAVRARLRASDASGVLATVAVTSGTLVALLWPLAALLHDLALETATAGTDPRILAGWDAAAPFGLALSALPRTLFIGAIVLGLPTRARRLRGTGTLVLALSLLGSATLVCTALFPVLAASTLTFLLWLAAVARRWSHPET
ncbi:hypothetical protein ACWDSJ_01100 [Nocardia sp. NPDC003482]